MEYCSRSVQAMYLAAQSLCLNETQDKCCRQEAVRVSRVQLHPLYPVLQFRFSNIILWDYVVECCPNGHYAAHDCIMTRRNSRSSEKREIKLPKNS